MSPARALPVPSWVLGLGLLLLVAMYFHHRVLMPGVESDLTVSDIHLYYLPTYELLYGALREGRLPLWNPLQICGLPQLGSLQAGFFYPGHLVYLWLSPVVGWWLSVVLHLTIVGLSLAWFVRKLGLCVGAAVAAAVFLALRGRYPWMALFPNLLEAATWLPLGAVALLGIVRDGRARWVALLAACAGLSLLAGYPQGSVYAVYSWGALLVVLLVAERGSVRDWGRGSALLGAALLLGFAIAAAQLLPAWELAGEGTRAPGPLTRAEQFPLGWHGPGFFGAFSPILKAQFPDMALSLGWTGIVGLLAAVFGRRHRMLAAGSFAVALLAFVFAMGPATPIFDWLSQLPAIGWFRFPRRALFMMDFFLAIPFAVGIHGLLELLRERVPQFRGPNGAWLALAPALMLTFEIFAAPPNDAGVRHALDLMAHYYRESPVYDRVAESGERAWLRSPSLETRQPPKLASYRGIKSVGDYEPVNQRRQSEYFTYLMEGRLTPEKKGRPYSGRLKRLTAPNYPDALKKRGHLLDVAAVKWFVVQRPSLVRGEIAHYTRTHGLEEDRTLRDPDFALLENPHAVPRSYVVYDVRPAPEPLELLQAMSERSFDPLSSSYAEGVERSRGRIARGAPARIVVDEPTRVEIEAELWRDGMLVLVDSWYPGWQARIQGPDPGADAEPLEILPVNHLFRGVFLPAGKHRVVFEYRPWTVPVGAATSLAGLAIVGLLWIRGRSVDELPVAGRSDSILADDEPGASP